MSITNLKSRLKDELRINSEFGDYYSEILHLEDFISEHHSEMTDETILNVIGGFSITFQETAPDKYDWQADLEEIVNTRPWKYRWLRDRGAFSRELKLVRSENM